MSFHSPKAAQRTLAIFCLLIVLATVPEAAGWPLSVVVLVVELAHVLKRS
jgi:hypothetical protein